MLNVSAAQAANQKPVANAGIDQSIGTGTSVQLDGRQSVDNDGNIKLYRWTQLKGQRIKLLNVKTATPSFTTPAALPIKTVARTLIFKLTVTDNKNKQASDTVTVNLVACNAPKILVNNICQLPPSVCYPPNKRQNGVCLPPAPLTCKTPLVPIDGICRLPPVVCDEPEVVQNGVCAVPVASTLINDTGVTLCSDTETNGNFCLLSNYPGQDAEFGRDKLFNDSSDGRAGFSFSKINAQGQELPVDATEWNCVKDNVTGLVWEIKTADGGLRDRNNLYSHFDQQFNPSSQYPASTEALTYVSAVNTQGLCGSNDWRLPSTDELQGIVDYGVGYPGPTIDGAFFPNTGNDKYWTSNLRPIAADQGWVVSFDDGRVFSDQRAQAYRVRLVRESRVSTNK